MATTQTNTQNSKGKKQESLLDWARRIKETEADAVAEKDWPYLAGIAPVNVLQEMAAEYMSLLMARVTSKPPLTAAERDAHAKQREEKKQEAARAAEASADKAIRQSLSVVGPDFVMGDGRRLGAWTIAELRKLGGVFVFILGRAGSKDDSRTVDQVMRPRDWKQAAKDPLV